ncbi:uncharacterized protein LOC108916170 [Anoplophora glabripennis]|uniref:uncharacterized protein LOC108916170 n=1 Tax=Anoplophora glabripennis TaxID=217634 RepID=UPI000874464B|nr:uncharacterized protein LOC108916170 [Anoplophora glabripennis]
MSCLVVPQITEALPNFKVDKHNLNIPENVRLADPQFDVPGGIDMLIGADCFWDVMCVGQIRLGKQAPYLQKTKFGWVMSGRVETTSNSFIQCSLSTNSGVDKQLSRFWDLEEFPQSKLLSDEERACEKHFVGTFTCDANGRFVVTIPLFDSPEKLGDSYETAKNRLFSLERKFKRNENFKAKYVKFIDEYRSLGHMLKLNTDDETKPRYYMPHHGVVREGSLTTKLRVVFDASCPTTSGYSFNDLQMTGPSIQSDIFSILLRYRKYNFVIASDVEKMYRMCNINAEQTPLQRILWRDNSNNPTEI